MIMTVLCTFRHCSYRYSDGYVHAKYKTSSKVTWKILQVQSQQYGCTWLLQKASCHLCSNYNIHTRDPATEHEN